MRSLYFLPKSFGPEVNYALEANRPRLRRIPLKEFEQLKEPMVEQEIMRILNDGGSFMCCHQMIREKTGIWIPELVPVFEKLDAMLTLRGLDKELK